MQPMSVLLLQATLQGCKILCKLFWLLPGHSADFHVTLLQLYTSGSTGKPKGVLHTTAGYMMGAGEAVAACTPEWHRQSLCAALLGLFRSGLVNCSLFQAALLSTVPGSFVTAPGVLREL